MVFSSFNADDEDYEGYDYSLFGQLSEVRVVYLNRFIQEASSFENVDLLLTAAVHTFSCVRIIIIIFLMGLVCAI